MRTVRSIAVALVLLGAAAPARADITGFLGATTTPSNRQVLGGAIGGGLLVVGFEFEYSATTEDTVTGAPSLKVGSGSGLLQTPLAVHGFQPYFIIGGGVYRETLADVSQTGFTGNVGGGVKIALAGPLRLRVDYRRFGLGEDARYSPSSRVYVGLNLKL
jgi:hypothetical protein